MAVIRLNIPGLGLVRTNLDAAASLPLEDALLDGPAPPWRIQAREAFARLQTCPDVVCEPQDYAVIRGRRCILKALVMTGESVVAWQAEQPVGGPFRLSPAAAEYLRRFDERLLAQVGAHLPFLRASACTALRARLEARIHALRHKLAAIEQGIDDSFGPADALVTILGEVAAPARLGTPARLAASAPIRAKHRDACDVLHVAG